MQFYYGEKTTLRILDEIEFWKRQEQEHTIVIRQLVPNLEMGFVEQLRQWEQVLARTEATAVKYIESVIRSKHNVTPALLQQIMQFVTFSLHQSEKFVATLNQIAVESEAVRNNVTALVVINHIRRESEYFIGIARTVLQYN